MRPLYGFEERYLIDEYGNVFTKKDNKRITSFLNAGGYSRLRIGKGTTKSWKTILVHRLVAMTYLPNPENKRTVNHKDCNRANNHVSNLEWATHTENVRHSAGLGRMGVARGEKNSHARLTDSQVIQIRKIIKSGHLGVVKICSMFNVSHSTIQHIKHGRSWKHLLQKV